MIIKPPFSKKKNKNKHTAYVYIYLTSPAFIILRTAIKQFKNSDPCKQVKFG